MSDANNETNDINDKIFKILNQLLENIKNLADLEPELHDILAFYFNVSLKLYEARKKGTQMDIDGQISFISEMLGISLRDIVERVLSNRKPNTSTQTPPVTEEQSKQVDDLTNLILSSASIVNLDDVEIEDYKQNVQKVLDEIKMNL